MLDKEKRKLQAKIKRYRRQGNFSTGKTNRAFTGFEKERAKWEHEKSFLMNQKDDAVESMQRLEKKARNSFERK